MKIWSRFTVSLTSADPNAALRIIQQSGITISDVEMVDALTWRFSVSRPQIGALRSLAEKRGELIRVEIGSGLFDSFRGLIRRPVLILGILFLLALSVWVPSRVLFVQVVGNESVSARLIAEQAQGCGIYFGASRRHVRSEQVKNQLLSRLPQLQWAGVNTSGCVAVITVRERSEEETEQEAPTVCSIVAARDGIVSEMTVLRGNGLCRPGQAVKAGQILISGYTDCGICIQATRAEGEVLAQTQHRLTAVFPEERVCRGGIIGTEEKISLIIGKKQINFSKDSGILGMSCAKIYEQKYVTLPGGFVLPVCLLREKIIYYATSAGLPDDGQASLRAYAREYITRQTHAGKIENEQIFVSAVDGLLRLEGIYGCVENIGTVRVEESLPNYGKSD